MWMNGTDHESLPECWDWSSESLGVGESIGQESL